MDEKIDHTKEWQKIAERYLFLAKEESLSDPMYYRYRCINGLLDETTYDYN